MGWNKFPFYELASRNWARAVSANCCDIRHIDTYDISDNSDSSESSDGRQKQTCMQDFATVCIRKRQYLGFGGP